MTHGVRQKNHFLPLRGKIPISLSGLQRKEWNAHFPQPRVQRVVESHASTWLAGGWDPQPVYRDDTQAPASLRCRRSLPDRRLANPGLSPASRTGPSWLSSNSQHLQPPQMACGIVHWTCTVAMRLHQFCPALPLPGRVHLGAGLEVCYLLRNPGGRTPPQSRHWTMSSLAHALGSRCTSMERKRTAIGLETFTGNKKISRVGGRQQ